MIDDPAWIRTQLEALTDHNESAFEHPWAVSDAPEEFTNRLLAEVVGIEIVITDIKGKWKVSQNRSENDRVSVAHGLATCGRHEMAQLVNQP